MPAALESINTYLTLSLLGIVLIVVIWLVILGLFRGLIRSSVRLGTILLALGLTFLTVNIMKSSFLPQYTPLIREYLSQLIMGMAPVAEDIVSSSDDLLVYVTDIASALVMPCIFAVVFWVYKFLTYIIFLIIKIFIPKKEEGISKGSRWGGAGISLISAFIIIICLTMPMTGYINFVSDEYEAVKETELLNEETVPADVDAVLTACSDNGMVKTLYACGGKLIFNSLTKVGDAGTAGEELKYLITTVGEIMPAVTQIVEDNPEGDGSYQQLNLSAVRETILPQLEKASPRIRNIMAEIFRAGAAKWKNNEAFLGINFGEMLGEEIGTSVGILLEELSVTQENSVIEDLGNFSMTIEDLSTCLASFKEIATNNPKASVATGKQVIDLAVIRTKIVPLINTSSVERSFMADVIQKAATTWKTGNYYLDINIKDLLGSYGDACDPLLDRLSNSTANTVVKDLTNVSLEMEVLSQTYVYFMNMKNTELSADTLQEDLTNILTTITPETVEIIKGTLTTSIVNNAGLKEGTEGAVTLLGDTLENMAELSPEERAQEAEALNRVLNYTSGRREEEVQEEGFVDAILGSSILGTTIQSTVEKNDDPNTSEEDKTNIEIGVERKTQLDNTINEKLTDPALTDQERDTLNALKKLFIVTP